MARSMADEWNYIPDVPTRPAPYLAWPPRPVESLRYIRRNYLSPTDRATYVVLAVVVALWLQPITAGQASLSPGWIGHVLIRNYLAVGVVVGGLHWWFYMRRGQADTLRYDARPLGRNRRIFAFGDQVRDNMAYTLLSGVPIASGFEIWARWMYANDHATEVGAGSSPVWFVLGFLVMPIWQSLHFYVVHRALHHESIYRHIHAVHHRNVNIGPWSGISMHPMEHLLYFSSLAIIVVLPTHPAHLWFLLYWQLLGAPSGHAGYDAMVVRGRSVLGLHSYFHQLHHRYLRCNYGSGEFPLDYWLGTLHDGTETSARRLIERNRS